MAGKILRCGTNWYFGFIDFDTNITPLSQGIKINPPLNKRLRKFFSSCLQRISPDRKRPLGLISLEELNQLGWIKKIQEVINKLKVIAIILMYKVLQILKMFLSTSSTTKFGHIH